MKKGEATRRNIIQKSATIFNQKGYITTTMNDIIQETKIQKGGIYRHFKDKEQLMHEAFQFSAETMRHHLIASVSQHEKADEKLIAFVETFLQLSEGKPMIGGCPIFNAAVEMDDLEGSTLLPMVNEAMGLLIHWVEKIIEEGIGRQELKQSVQPFDTAVYIVSTIEGGLVLSKLKQDGQVTNIIKNQLFHYISMMNERQ